jgi:hypothetical protein
MFHTNQRYAGLALNAPLRRAWQGAWHPCLLAARCRTLISRRLGMAEAAFRLMLMLAICAAAPLAVAAPNEWWVSADEPDFIASVYTVAADATGIYVAGNAYRPSDPRSGGGFARKYDPAGKVLWTAWPLANLDPSVIGVDATGIYIAGRGRVGAGNFKGAVARLNPANGQPVWSRLLDVDATFWSIALHFTGIYLGTVRDGFSSASLFKLDRSGNPVWLAPPVVGTSNMTRQIAVDDSGIYILGQAYIDDVRKFDFEGREIARFGGPSRFGRPTSLVVDSSGVYVSTFDAFPWPGHPVHRKYTPGGQLLWQRIFYEGKSDASMAVNSTGGVGGPYATGYDFDLPFVFAPIFSRLTQAGNHLWTRRFDLPAATESANFYSYAVAGTGLYAVGFRRIGSGDSYKSAIARISQDQPPEVQVLRDLNANAAPEIAVLLHDSAAPRVTAVLKDSASSALVRRIAFDAQYWPRQLLRLPDANANGSEDLVVLGVHRVTGVQAAEVRDGRTGELLARVMFDRFFKASRLLALDDLNGNGTPELALLESSELRAKAQTEVRDSITGALIRRIDLPALNGTMLLDHVMTPDGDSNGRDDLAALGVQPYGAQDRFIAINDPKTGNPVASRQILGYRYNATRLAGLPDGNRNGVPELAILGQDGYPNNVPGVFMFEGSSTDANPVRTVAFDKTGRLQDLRRIADLNGNGYPEIAVIKTDTQPGRGTVQIKDGLSGVPIANHSFPSAGYSYRDVAVCPDLNRNGSPELVLLQQRKSDGQVTALILDARTGTLIRSIAY